MTSSPLDVLTDPQMRHAVLIHLPIALAILGLIPAALSFFTKLGKAPVIVTIALYLLLIATAWGGVLSGESAEDQIGAPPYIVRMQVHDHEEAAEKIWYFALAATILGLGGLIKAPKVALTAKSLTLLAGVGAAGVTGYAAHLGGSLVYDYGIGTPNPLTTAALEERPPEMLADPRATFFLSDVRPILVDSCMGCHTRDDKPDAQLDLSTPAGVLAGSEYGPVIVPGDPAASTLYTTVSGEHPDFKMPAMGDDLTAEQIAAIHKWITDGAVWAEPSKQSSTPPTGNGETPSDD